MAKVYPDISHYHPVKDWNQFSESVGFAISKGTQGTSFVDSYLKTFVKECESRHIPYWLYTYLNKGNEVEQAKFLVKTCKPIVGDYFVGYALDAEEDNAPEDLREALAWISGQCEKCMVYTGWADYDTYIFLTKRAENVGWWEARYGNDNGKYNKSFPCHEGVDLHQYTSNGTCPGIPDTVDLNRLTGNKPLSWFASNKSSEETKKKVGYSGQFPTLPKRGYFREGDGYLLSIKIRKQVKLVQKLVNWITGGDLAIDGKYGEKTAAGVARAQKKLKVAVDGYFGEATLAAAKAYKK